MDELVNINDPYDRFRNSTTVNLLKKVFKWCDHCHRKLKFGRWTRTNFNHQRSEPKKDNVLRHKPEKNQKEDQVIVKDSIVDKPKENGQDDKEVSFTQQLSQFMSCN